MKSYVKFKIKGLNQERFFNKLSKEVDIFELHRFNKSETSFIVYIKDKKFVLAELISNNFFIESQEERGLISTIKGIFSRWGLVASMIVVIAAYLTLNQFILQTKVIGNDRVSEDEIISIVESLGYKGIISKGKFSAKEIENKLLQQINDLSFASAITKGQTLIINVKEKLAPDEMENEFLPLKSKFSGQITKIKLISGTLACKVGDIVSEGETLVLPYIIDSSGNERKVIAKAEITADVWITEEITHQDVTFETIRTGKSCEEIYLKLFGLPVYHKAAESNFKSYELIEEEKPFVYGNILPYKLLRKTYYETESVLVETPFSKVKDEKLKEAREKALQKVLEYDIIKKEHNSIDSIAGVNRITYVITVERRLDIDYLR